MITDGVSTAFNMILEELDVATKEVNNQGAEFMKQGKYDEAKGLIATGERLADFRKKLNDLRTEWLGTFDESTRQRVKVESQPLTAYHKSPKTGLRVTLPNGTVINEAKAAITFAFTLKALGLDRVRKLGKRVSVCH